MKTVRKAVLSVLCVALVIVASITGTLAYLTDTETAKNTFTVGNVQIKLDELDVDNSTEGENDRDQANQYHLLPGQAYTKDPMVTIEAGSEESYVRMLVTVSNLQKLKNAFPITTDDTRYEGWYDANGNFLLQNLVTGWDQSKWPCVGITPKADGTCVYEFRYYTTVDGYDTPAGKTEEEKMAVELEKLFTNIVIPGTVDNDELEYLNAFQIDVEAHAIQAAGFDDADAAWAAFEAQKTTNS